MSKYSFGVSAIAALNFSNCIWGVLYYIVNRLQDRQSDVMLFYGTG